MLEELADNVEAQQRLLAEVAQKPALTRLVNRVASYTLGVIPIARADDAIVFARFPGGAPGVEAVLGRHVQAPVRLVDFDENVMSFFVDRLYLKGKSVNIHTFGSEGFLDDPASDAKLMEPKAEAPSPAGSEVPPGDLVLADFELLSDLANLDRGQAARLDNYRLGEFCPAFRRDGDRWIVWSPEPVPTEASVLLQFAEGRGGEEFFRDLSAIAVREWPHVIFPSEVQLLGASRDGGLHVYLDGATTLVRPGEPRELRTEYFMLRHGYRWRRRITMSFAMVTKVRRSALRYEPPFRGAGAEEFRKWLRTG